MSIFESFLSALSGIMGNKTRSVLTMFGIIVGIGSVIMIISIGQGYRESITKQFEEIGLDRFTLRTNSQETIEYDDRLTYEDVLNLRKYDEIAYVTGTRNIYIGSGISLMDHGKTRDVYIQGVDEDFFNVQKVELSEGRYIVEHDIKGSSPVIIIDEDLAAQVFGKTNVIGESIQITSYWNMLECTIIGLIKSDRNTQMMALYDRYAMVCVPLSYVNASFWDDPTLNSIILKGKDVLDLKRISDNAIRLTEIRHDNVNENKYLADITADNMKEVNTIIGIFTMFMGFVAAISLLVGGIGVMNIMLVSVTERTREIGIRKSLGATRGNIKLQFLVEAVILTAIGGMLGILFGYGGGLALGSLASMMMGEPVTPALTTGSVVMVTGISAAIGILFGVYPAAQAAKLDPIEALRFEN